jgi:hypothetical protein
MISEIKYLLICFLFIYISCSEECLSPLLIFKLNCFFCCCFILGIPYYILDINLLSDILLESILSHFVFFLILTLLIVSFHACLQNIHIQFVYFFVACVFSVILKSIAKSNLMKLLAYVFFKGCIALYFTFRSDLNFLLFFYK